MAIGGRALADTIQLQQWFTLVPDTRGAQRLLVKDIAELAGRIGGQADELLAEFAEGGISHEVLKVIRDVIGTRTAHLLRIIEKA
jgi:serine/threonine-protein kinase HipA